MTRRHNSTFYGCAVVVAALARAFTPVAAQPPRVHRMPATPKMVVVGHFSAASTPVLRIASGDIIDVDTMITSSPQGLERLGLPPGEVQASLREITTQVTDRGPGGHILNGPVFVEGSRAGDALEVKVLSVDLAVPYGYAACSD